MSLPWRGLSARLLVLTAGFVMLAEILVFVPSVGRFRTDWLEAKLAAAHLAILALEATPDGMVSPALEAELLSHVGAYSAALATPDRGKLMLMLDTPRHVDATYDLREQGPTRLLGDGLYALFLAPEGRLLRVLGPAPRDPALTVEIVIDERPLKAELAGFALRILGLSLIISIFAAAVVYLALHLLIVRPVRRVTESMVAFRAAPERAPLFEASERADEIGVAGRELSRMQAGLRQALGEQARLAALGTAVTKINHDLRNILSTVRLVSDGMTGSADPEVRRLTPPLLRAIDRAITLCEGTLTFVREGRPPLEIAPFLLADLAAEVGASLPPSGGGPVTWLAEVPLDLTLQGDRAQLFRALANLARNAVEAGATRVSLIARRLPQAGGVELLLSDNGPGLSPRAKAQLFQPFAASGRAGGSGLGLAIAREIAQLHSGDLTLVDSGAKGTTFRLILPGTG